MARREFKSVQDVVRYLAFLTRETQSGRMDPKLSGKLCYIMNTMLKALELAHLEKQLKRLEAEVLKTEMAYNAQAVIDLPIRAIEGGKNDDQIPETN